MKYDYLIVGSGLFGATFAYRAKQIGKKCLVIDKRNHIGGNVYTRVAINVRFVEVERDRGIVIGIYVGKGRDDLLETQYR